MTYFVRFSGGNAGRLYRVDDGLTNLTKIYINTWISLNSSYMYVEIDE